jgi:hypothetical protein
MFFIYYFLCGRLVQRLPNKTHHFPGTGDFNLVGMLSCNKQPVAFLVQPTSTTIGNVNKFWCRVCPSGLYLFTDACGSMAALIHLDECHAQIAIARANARNLGTAE